LFGHDLKPLIKVLILNKIKTLNPIFDVMIASYLLSPGSRAHDPASVVLKVLGKELPTGSGQESLFGVDARSAAEELWLIYQTADKLKQDLIKTDDLGLFQKVEMPLIFVLAEMELNGIAVDLKMLAKLSAEAKIAIKKLTQKIYKMSGQEFNIASPLQLREVLFEKMDIPVAGIKKGKTGLSTSADELEKLRGLHPIIDEISNYRELAKLQNTYIDVLPTLINKKTGRIHTTFNQAVTATGRLSSSDPNLQNIPIRTELGREVRKTFISELGNTLISADYSQIELRIVASLAEDKRMMEIFEKDEDIHTATAAAINGVPLSEVTKAMRRAAKEVNFGVLYGMGVYGLSWRAEIPPYQAKEFIEKYFREFSGVKKYIEQNLAFTKKEGYCETLFGRRRYLPELKSANHQLRAAAERMAINHPVQGTAADLMKMAMIEVAKKIQDLFCHPERAKRAEGSLKHNERDSSASVGMTTSDVKMLLQVHDELIFEVKKGTEDEVSKTVKEIMEKVVKLRVPIKVEVHSGHSWGEIK
ncbi:MAG: DNA polymerase, partial [Candidatus Komeilibacteria bacterium]|nr:DNA polymerase [Candidatus Komeilibacteria bacterium]